MKSFKEFMSEMADPIGINISSNLSKEDTYNSLILMKEKFNIISDNVGNRKYDIVEYNGTYYLINKYTKNYLGHIQTESDNINGDKAIFIDGSYSTGETKGIYGMMFTHIFKDTNIKYIFGDKAQSTQAIESWRKVIKSFDGVVLDLSTNIIIPYDENKTDEYWKKGTYNIRVGIVADKEYIEESFRLTFERVSKDSGDGVYRKMFNLKDHDLDLYFYPSYRMSLS
jgi:hypothetical protein